MRSFGCEAQMEVIVMPTLSTLEKIQRDPRYRNKWVAVDGENVVACHQELEQVYTAISKKYPNSRIMPVTG